MYRSALLVVSLMVATSALAQTNASTRLHQVEAASRVSAESSKRFAVQAVDFNSAASEFSPVADRGEGLVFVSSRPAKGSQQGAEGEFFSLFHTVESEAGTFSTPERKDAQVLSSYHEGPVVFFDSGRQKIFTRNAFIRRGKLKDNAVQPLELAHSSLLPSGAWSVPARLDLSPPGYSAGHPAITADGRTLYFSSNMPGTLGESDLFVSRYENGSWSSPRNLGPSINTSAQELFPFLFNDSILYFASNGRGGLGGLDLFSCSMKSGSRAVSHLDAPLNSVADDFGIFVEAGGVSGFFSSNREGGAGGDDIYYFDEVHRFSRIQLYDSLSGKPVPGATLSLLADGDTTGVTRSDILGESEFRWSLSRQYVLAVSANDYEPAIVEMNASTLSGPAVQLRIYLKPLNAQVGKVSPGAVHLRSRNSVTNVIAFSSSVVDVDVAADLPAAPADAVKPVEDSTRSTLRVIIVEIVNSVPAVIAAREDTVYQFQRSSNSELVSNELNISIDIPMGAKRSDYERIISGQINVQGYAISNLLLIRSFFFDSGKNWVRNDACAQLDKIIEVMHAHPAFELEMTFHSDSRGTEAFNLDLSKARAEEVTAYLNLGGVDQRRIHSSFVGEGRLLNDCGDLSDCDELLHQINRTVEFKFKIR